ncbi:MAG: hypothetical protein LBM93_00700 [Oscillospiraceae bacterium]|jgi:hypothetical protein|nr:hypothetical protein [Oscillospiraceae bacterium]
MENNQSQESKERNFFIDHFRKRMEYAIIGGNIRSATDKKELEITKNQKMDDFFSEDGLYVNLFSFREPIIENYTGNFGFCAEQPTETDRSKIIQCGNKSDIETFESNLKKLSHTVMAIQGHSGCGKTTYLHYLKRKFTKENKTLNFKILNLTIKNYSFCFMGFRWLYNNLYN